MKDLKCKKHPTYKAIRKPTADCKACREMYGAKHTDRETKWQPLK